MKLIKKALGVALTAMIMASSCSLVAAVNPKLQDTSLGDDWLTTKGSKIVDKNGNEVWLTGCNWFGFNTETRMFDGVWGVNLEQALKGIADHGINFLRIPVTTQIIQEWMTGKEGKAANVNTYLNPNLEGKNNLELFDEVVRLCKENGIKIMVDIHSPMTDGLRHFYELWYDEDYPIEVYHETLEWLTDRYKNDDTIVAIDLQNEPHGKPGSTKLWAKWDGSKDQNNWRYAAEVAATKVLNINPNLLVMIEGVEAYPKEGYDYTARDELKNPRYYYNWWGGNLRGVKDYPVKLKKEHQNQIVYSPHDYGPAVYMQSWFEGDFTKQSVYEDCWKDNWAYIAEDNIAPLLIGEWGGFLDKGKNQQWLENLRDFIKENKINHTFWCYNPNSGDTGGLVNYDFLTWDEAKYALLKPVLWQTDSGKFIGLDHQIPLGKNGITVSDYYQGTSSKPETKPEVKPENKPETKPDKPNSSLPSPEVKPEVPSEGNPHYLLGDVNQDGHIDSLDWATLYRYMEKQGISLDKHALQNADVNEDKQVNTKDLTLIKDYIIGNIDAF